jgi:probable HAF family extracellular repeat protein
VDRKSSCRNEEIMNRKKSVCVTTMALLVALAIPVSLGAQEHPTNHHQYELVDMGTLGGPASYTGDQFANPGTMFLNNSGIDSGVADTSTVDPYSPNCFFPDCFVAHAFRWDSGVSTDLGALPGGSSSAGTGINARGWLAGSSQNGAIDPLTQFPENRAVLWTDDQMIDLGTIEGGYESIGLIVNNRGQVTGFASNLVSDPFFGTQLRTFLWDDQNGMQDLGTLGGPDSPPFGNMTINERGQVVGCSFTNSTVNPVTGFPTTDPFLWEKGNGMTDLGTLGGTLGFPFSLNNRGQVVGNSNVAGDLTFHPFLWDRKKGIKDLGTLGGNNGSANQINEDGDVVGKADLPGSQTHDGFLWRKGTMTDLGTLPGDPCTRANWINERRQIVGNSSDCTWAFHALLWEDGGPPIDLNTLIAPNSSLHLTNANNINERGEIAGSGVPAGCQPADVDTCGHAYLLIPCGHGHADEKECGENPGNSAPMTPRPTVITPHPVSNEKVAPSRIPLIRGHRTSGGGA